MSALGSHERELADEVMRRVWDNYPGYSSEQVSSKEVLGSIERNVQLAVRVVARNKPPTREELGEGRRLGARRAIQSIPLESVIQAFRVAERVVLTDLLDQFYTSGVEATRDAVGLLIDTFDMLTQETINSYREASRALDARTERLESDLVSSLMSDRPLEQEDLDHQTQLLGVDPLRLYQAAVVLGYRASDPLETVRLRSELIRSLSPIVSGRILFGEVPGGLVVLIPDPPTKQELVCAFHDAMTTLRQDEDIVAAVGSVSGSLRSVDASSRQALACAEVGRRLGFRQQLVRHEDHLVDVLLMREPDIAAQLMGSRLGSLLRHPHLLETVEALLENNLSQVRTAQQLVIHPNTVSYRVRRIQKLTGLNPVSTRDAFELSIALRGLKLGLEENP